MMSIEPYNENFAHRILSIYGRMGNRAAAINYYKKFEGQLRLELNIAPNSELKLLYRTLMEGPAGKRCRCAGPGSAVKQELTIETRCMKDVHYFWAADVVGALLRKVDEKYLLELDVNYILDLSYIQNELLLSYERLISREHKAVGTVPSVRIVNAFLKFMSHVSAIYSVQIRIVNSDEMDPSSLMMLKHIEASASGNIIITR